MDREVRRSDVGDTHRPQEPTGRKPPALIDVAAEIGDVVVKVRSILPQMLFDDLDELLAAYRH